MAEKERDIKLIGKRRAERRINQMAQAIVRDFPNPEEVIIVVAAEGGSYIAHLLLQALQKLDYAIPVVSFKISSYRGTEETNGKPAILTKPDDAQLADIQNKLVLFVDDIADTAITAKTAIKFLIEECQADAVTTVFFLSKDERRQVSHQEAPAHFVGFHIKDWWVFGMGIDKVKGLGRGFNHIRRKVTDKELETLPQHWPMTRFGLRRLWQSEYRQGIRKGTSLTKTRLPNTLTADEFRDQQLENLLTEETVDLTNPAADISPDPD